MSFKAAKSPFPQAVPPWQLKPPKASTELLDQSHREDCKDGASEGYHPGKDARTQGAVRGSSPRVVTGRTPPTCIKRETLFPLPAIEHYNRTLKEIAAQNSCVAISHSARYFFANEILFDNEVRRKKVAGIMRYQASNQPGCKSGPNEKPPAKHGNDGSKALRARRKVDPKQSNRIGLKGIRDATS
jgi:hypothetical protein